MSRRKLHAINDDVLLDRIQSVIDTNEFVLSEAAEKKAKKSGGDDDDNDDDSDDNIDVEINVNVDDDSDGDAADGKKDTKAKKEVKKEAKDDVDLDKDPEVEKPPEATKKATADLKSATAKVKPAKRNDKGTAEDDDDQEDMEKVKQEDWIGELVNLLSEQTNLSEDFQREAIRIFREEMKRRVEVTVDKKDRALREAYEQQMGDYLQEAEDAMTEKVDKYLDYIVEKWSDDNRIGIQSGLRAKITEDFIENLKTLFVESYIEVPESKVDLLEDIASAYKKEKRMRQRLIERSEMEIEDMEGAMKRLEEEQNYKMEQLNQVYEDKLTKLKRIYEEKVARMEQENAGTAEKSDDKFSKLRHQHEDLIRKYELMNDELQNTRKAALIAEHTTDLTVPQQELLREQLEDEPYVSDEDFLERIDMLKRRASIQRRRGATDNHFTLTEAKETPEEVNGEMSDAMSVYVKSMGGQPRA